MLHLNDTSAGANIAEVLPARDWACLLQVTDRAVRKAVSNAGGGYIARTALPARWQEQLSKSLHDAGARDLHHLLRVQRGHQHKTTSRTAFTEKNESTKRKAMLVREAIFAYFQARDAGRPDKEAVPAARSRWAELFGRSPSAKTIRRWRDRIEAARPPGKTVYEVSLVHFADNKDVPHHKARIENRGIVPKEFIRAFRAECLKPGMEHVSSAFRKFEIDWLEGKEVPGFGHAPQPGATFPLRLAQVRKYQPGHAARRLAARGKAAARVGVLPTIRRDNSTLHYLEKITLDDTRANIYAQDDITGRVVELKLYFAMDVASRRIVGWLIREAGGVKAADVDALVARILQGVGFAHPHAGYSTTLKFERGCVACSPAKQVLLEGLHPNQIRVSRTSMDGGRNAPGDYDQAASGHWFGKGEIESFMRTLAFYTEHFKGQRGGVWRRQPAQLGTVVWRPDGTPRLTAGSMLEEATTIAQAGRALAVMRSSGTDTCPSAAEAATRFGLKSPLYYVHEVIAALPGVIHYYNTLTDHRRDGFADVREERPEGGISFRKESCDERAARLLTTLEARGVAPVTLPDSDVVILLHSAKTVSVTRNGVNITIDGNRMRYFSPDSAAIRAAMANTTRELKCVALIDDERPERIHLLKNSPSNFQPGDDAKYWETLPLEAAAAANDPVALSRAMESTRHVHNTVARELAVAFEPVLRERERERESNLDTLRSVTVAAGGLRNAIPGSALGRQISEAHAIPEDPAPATTREEQRRQATPSYLRRLAEAAAEEPV